MSHLRSEADDRSCARNPRRAYYNNNMTPPGGLPGRLGSDSVVVSRGCVVCSLHRLWVTHQLAAGQPRLARAGPLNHSLQTSLQQLTCNYDYCADLNKKNHSREKSFDKNHWTEMTNKFDSK